MTAHRAFQFCKQYKRTTEFRRLCEIIRNHLTNLNKYRDQRDRPDLSVPESLQLYLDTRFEQLKVATELELWQVSQVATCLFNKWLNTDFCLLIHSCRKLSVQLKTFMVSCAWWRKHQNRHSWLFTMLSWLKYSGSQIAICIMPMLGTNFMFFKKALIRT